MKNVKKILVAFFLLSLIISNNVSPAYAQLATCDTVCGPSECTCPEGCNEEFTRKGLTCGGIDGLNPTTPLTQDALDAFNPLKTENEGEGSEFADELSTPGGIISRFLGSFAFPLGGLILFVMLVWGGFEMMSGAATKKSVDAGKQRVTAALIGFLLLFISYWIVQIMEVVFGIEVL